MKTAFSALALIFLLAPLREGLSQSPSPDIQDKVDALVAAAYQSANAGFPCKLKTRGKPKMIRWENLDGCLSDAANRVDWEEFLHELGNLRTAGGISATDLFSAVESSLSAHAIPYDAVFSVDNTDALLPLTHSLLKYLPAGSLEGLPVYSKSGARVGAFSGVYSYERTGGLTAANTYRLSYFQYTDLNGNIQSAGERLLLDSFGVPWSGAMNQLGFRLVLDGN